MRTTGILLGTLALAACGLRAVGLADAEGGTNDTAPSGSGSVADGAAPSKPDVPDAGADGNEVQVCTDTSTDPQNCGACGRVCVGSDSGCTSGICSATLGVRAFIDDQSRLEIKGSSVRWLHDVGAAPGRWEGNDHPTYLDGVAWMPAWPESGENRDCGCASSSTTVTPLGARAQTVELEVVTQRGGGVIAIVQQPAAGNGFTAIVSFYDSAGGADWSEIRLRYQTD